MTRRLTFRLLLLLCVAAIRAQYLPVVLNTWKFTDATSEAWHTISEAGHNVRTNAALDAVEKQGCSKCEREQCDFTVGFGGSPDEVAETTLDAMIMSGEHMQAGSVCDLRHVKDAISAARLVMQHTKHTTLSGLQATAFAQEMGLKLANLSTPASSAAFYSWPPNTVCLTACREAAKCQPNFRRHVTPKASTSCGPYQPADPHADQEESATDLGWVAEHNHDTIAMVAIDSSGNIAAGASSNGANHKVPGRVGDACIPGGAAFADNDVGGCGSTGDGDLHLRLLPCYQVVESMRQGLGPQQAAEDAILRILKHYPNYIGAVFAVDKAGNHAGACHGWTFQYSFQNSRVKSPQVVIVQPVKSPLQPHDNGVLLQS